MTFPRIAIIGPGLLGGSIARAIRARHPGSHIAIWTRRPDSLPLIQSMGLSDRASTDLSETVDDAEMIVLSVPIGAMAPLGAAFVSSIKHDAIITDVGSVKAPVVDSLSAIFKERGRFVGSHPMAGSERSGLAASRADLFEGTACILTPHPGADPDAISAVDEFWVALGCRTCRMPAMEHDEAMALVSHLPHLLAAALVNFVHARAPRAFDVCGNGFRDTTRIASGSPDMWAEIFATNRDFLKNAVNNLSRELAGLGHLLDEADDESMRKILAQAKETRDALAAGN